MKSAHKYTGDLADVAKALEVLRGRVDALEERIGVETPDEDGPAADYTYTGQLFPRVYPTHDGRRLVQFHPEQRANLPVHPTAVPTLPIAPGIRFVGTDTYELMAVPGKAITGRLTEDGVHLSPERLETWPDYVREALEGPI